MLGAPFKKQVDDALATVDELIHQRLSKAGYTVEIGDMLVNMEPDLKGKQTPDGRPWECMDGVFLVGIAFKIKILECDNWQNSKANPPNPP